MTDNELDGDKQRNEMRKTQIAVCASCAYWETGTSSCAAFPFGIPKEIFLWGFDHRKPYKGDHGIQFKKADD